jgi:hypothetical protein
MNEIKYNFYHWGPFLFHSTMEPELCKLMLDEGLKVRGKSDELYTHKLAGHLGEQYKLSRDKIMSKLTIFLEGYCIGYNKWRGGGGMKPKAKLLSMWINYMKAGDFNPPHSHGADLSFVAFPDVPTEIEEECAAFKGTMRGPGGLSWIYGEGDHTCISVVHQLPKTGDLYIFPASLKHYVFPFKSPVTRVSVSGNIILDQDSRIDYFTKKEKK